MLAAIRSATVFGVEGRPVVVEVHVSTGLPGFHVVGLPDEACREARDRARAAVLSSGLVWPNRRITVNLAPSGLRKAGSGLDLAIAVGVLVAADELPPEAAEGLGFVAELGLDGRLRPVPGVAPMVMAMLAAQPELRPVVALESHGEAYGITIASAASGVTDSGGVPLVRVAGNLSELVSAMRGEQPWPDTPDLCAGGRDTAVRHSAPDLADVKGQPAARLALELSAAGGHHLLFVGPPGAGKTMLAERLPGLLPPLEPNEVLEATMVHSAAGVRLPGGGLVAHPPFRAPHHSSTLVSLVGGGSSSMRPGEISLASRGVLFLDELGEFAPAALDALRQPLEDGVVRVARARTSATLPAHFLLVAATNPCPCGGGAPGDCQCDEGARFRYLRRLSGPLLDRFDLRVAVTKPDVDELMGAGEGESTAIVAVRVRAARQRSLQRIGILPSAIPGARLDELAPMSPPARELLRRQLEANLLTGRGFHRVRRVARTLADLDGEHELVSDAHVATALALRVRLRVDGRGR